MKRWLRIAGRRDVVQRSTKVAVLVGTILIAINYGDKIAAAQVGSSDYVKMALTYAVPYCVSTYASVSAILKG